MKVVLKIPVQGSMDDAWDVLKVNSVGFESGPKSASVEVPEEARDGPLILRPSNDEELAYWVEDEEVDPFHLAAFATAVHTVRMFEADDVLAHRIRWREGRPRLELWFPHRSRGESPAYDPRSGRLDLPSYDAGEGGVHSARSRDVVAHETAHAILDGLAPDLADATTPQSLAIHESLADLVAFISSLQSKTLRRRVASEIGRNDTNPDAVFDVFAQIAESYAQGLKGRSWLRSLSNRRGLEGCREGFLPLTPEESTRPHALGQVMGGVMFDFARRLYALYRGPPRSKSCAQALKRVADQFKRLVLRPLDYLPPGDLTFGDFLTTVLASDLAIHPYHAAGDMHGFLRQALDARGAYADVPRRSWLGKRLYRVERDDDATLADRILRQLTSELEPPDREPSLARSRLNKRVTQVLGRHNNRDVFPTVRVPERVIKLSWIVREEGPEGPTGLRVGATVVLDELGWVRLVVRGRPERQARERYAWIERALQAGLIGDRRSAPILRERTPEGLLVYRGTGRSLHLTARSLEENNAASRQD